MIRPRDAAMRDAPIRLFALAACAAVSACSSFFGGDPSTPACPPINVLSDADRLTVYRPGPGRDLSDIAYEARIVGFEGDCAYTAANKDKRKEGKYTDVTLNLRPRLRVTPGPALGGPRVTLDYFVAMPAYYPNPAGRAEFSQIADIPPNRTPIEFTDNDIQIRIPLGETKLGSDVPVYLGFNLTQEQLEQNRRRTGGRLEP